MAEKWQNRQAQKKSPGSLFRLPGLSPSINDDFLRL
jgi:hypothetical protein